MILERYPSGFPPEAGPPLAERGGDVYMPCVYVLYSRSRDVFYKGSTHDDNPGSRSEAHNSGYVRSTKAGVPWELVHAEFFKDMTEARRRELFLKTGAGRKWIKDNFWRGTQAV
jgi:putative endonuclease